MGEAQFLKPKLLQQVIRRPTNFAIITADPTYPIEQVQGLGEQYYQLFLAFFFKLLQGL